MINGVNGQTSAAQGINRLNASQNAIQKLEQQKQIYQEEMDRVKNDKTIDVKTAKTKMDDLKKKIEAIEAEIKQLKLKKNDKSNGTQSLLESAKTKGEDKTGNIAKKDAINNMKDVFEKNDTKEKWDATYSLALEDGKTKIIYNRPKEEDKPGNGN